MLELKYMNSPANGLMISCSVSIGSPLEIIHPVSHVQVSQLKPREGHMPYLQPPSWYVGKSPPEPRSSALDCWFFPLYCIIPLRTELMASI